MKLDTKVKSDERLERMPDKMRKQFVDLLGVQSVSSNEHLMHYYLISLLNKKGYSWMYDHAGNILVTKGEAKTYPCIVAHMDTVHSIKNKLVVWRMIDEDDENEILFGRDEKEEEAGIGGDDKCGIFAVLGMLDHFTNIKVVFFTQEENGCKGSGVINLDFFDDVGYVIQLDRWGREDFICKDHSTSFVSKKFLAVCKPLMEEFGYKEASGLTTDSVKLFNRKVGKSCINLSCGYYSHHTDDEYIDLNQFYHSLKFTKGLITALGENEYIRMPDEPSKTNWQDKYPSFQNDNKIVNWRSGVPSQQTYNEDVMDGWKIINGEWIRDDEIPGVGYGSTNDDLFEDGPLFCSEDIVEARKDLNGEPEYEIPSASVIRECLEAFNIDPNIMESEYKYLDRFTREDICDLYLEKTGYELIELGELFS